MVFPASRKGLFLLLALGGVSLWLGRAPISRWQERRLVEKARGFLRNRDLRSAYLASREALLKNPKSVEACLIAAQVADLEHSPAAIGWRQQLADLQPGRGGPLIELAATATHFGETFIAEQALAQVRESDRERIDFRQVSAGLAITVKQYAAEEAELQKALDLDPANEGLQLRACQEISVAFIEAVLDAARSSTRRGMRRVRGATLPFHHH